MTPNPPFSLGLRTISHAAKDCLGVSEFPLQRHWRIIRSNCLMMPGGIDREHSKYIGMDERTDLSSWSLQPWFNIAKLAVKRLSSESTKGIRSRIVGLVVPKGRPR